MNAGPPMGADMRTIYLRSLLFAFGLAAFVAIELFAPHGVGHAPAARAALGTPHGPA